MRIVDKVRELNHARVHGFPKGLTIGDPELDKYLNFIQGNTLYIHAYPAAGKTTFNRWLQVQLAKKYGWKCKMYDTETGDEERVFYELIEFWCERPMKEINDEMYSDAFKMINKHFFVITDPTPVKDILTDLSEFQSLSIDHMGTVKDRVNYDFIDEFLPSFNHLMKKTNTHGTILTHPKKDIGFKQKQTTDEGDIIWFYPIATPDRIWMGQSWEKYGNNIIHLWRPAKGMVNGKGELYEDNIVYLYTQKIKPKEAGKINFVEGIKLKYWDEKRIFHSEGFHKLDHLQPIKPNENFLDDETPF